MGLISIVSVTVRLATVESRVAGSPGGHINIEVYWCG